MARRFLMTPTNEQVLYWHKTNVARWRWLQDPETQRTQAWMERWRTEAIRQKMLTIPSGWDAILCGKVDGNGKPRYDYKPEKPMFERDERRFIMIPIGKLAAVGALQEALETYIPKRKPTGGLK
jgi:hypothetical protein